MSKVFYLILILNIVLLVLNRREALLNRFVPVSAENDCLSTSRVEDCLRNYETGLPLPQTQAMIKYFISDVNSDEIGGCTLSLYYTIVEIYFYCSRRLQKFCGVLHHY